MNYVPKELMLFAFRFANPNHAASVTGRVDRVVRREYDAFDRVTKVDYGNGLPIDFAYTKYGRLAGKYLGGREKPDAAVEYEYSKSGQIVARTANGVRQTYEYDGRGQLLAVKENGADVERYAYDKAGNMLRKTLRLGRAHTPGAPQYQITTFTFDGAKTYTYGYHVDGQLARADYGKTDGNGGRAGCPQPAGSEDFLWDGLALIKRGDERFVNEPHVGGGNPVASSKGTTYFNDLLGTTVGAKTGCKYTAAALTAFGEEISAPGTKQQAPSTFYTGKPEAAGLGHVFLFRNYRASFAKWQTADPLGYPDGWNALAYCNNGVMDAVDWLGAREVRRKTGETNVKDIPCGEWIDNGDGREYQWWLKTWNDVYDIFDMEESDWEKWLERLGLGAEVIGGAITAIGIAVASGPLGWAGIAAVLAGMGIEVTERQLRDSQPPNLKVVMEGFVDPKLKFESYRKWRTKE